MSYIFFNTVIIDYLQNNGITIISLLRTIIDVFLVWAVLYYIIAMVRKNNRTLQIFKGILFIIILKVVTSILQFTVLSWLIDNIINWGVVAVIIIFQPEIRNALEKLGRTDVKGQLEGLSDDEKNVLIYEITNTVEQLSKNKVGALITFERKQSLVDIIATGVPINADINSSLLLTIFKEGTVLHDGAVIIQGNQIKCASAFFPPTERELPPKYGARHRAALGLSEISDALTIVVSEETGTVSFAEYAHLKTVALTDFKQEFIKGIGGFISEVKSGGEPDGK